jgi:hypothetical protein
MVCSHRLHCHDPITTSDLNKRPASIPVCLTLEYTQYGHCYHPPPRISIVQGILTY